LVGLLEFLPKDHPEYESIRVYLDREAEGLRRTQDAATGLFGGRTAASSRTVAQVLADDRTFGVRRFSVHEGGDERFDLATGQHNRGNRL
jgi:hypothetical protein